MNTFHISVLEALKEKTCSMGKVRINFLVDSYSIRDMITIDADLVGKYLSLDDEANILELVEWINEGSTVGSELDTALRIAIIDFITTELDEPEIFTLPLGGSDTIHVVALNHAINKGLAVSAFEQVGNRSGAEQADWPEDLKVLYGDSQLPVDTLVSLYHTYGKVVWRLAKHTHPSEVLVSALRSVGTHPEDIVPIVGMANLPHDLIHQLPDHWIIHAIGGLRDISLDDYYLLIERLREPTSRHNNRRFNQMMQRFGRPGAFASYNRRHLGYDNGAEEEVKRRPVGKINIEWSPIDIAVGCSMLLIEPLVEQLGAKGALFTKPVVDVTPTTLPRDGDPSVIYLVGSYENIFDQFISTWIKANPECRVVLNTAQCDLPIPAYSLSIINGQIYHATI